MTQEQFRLDVQNAVKNYVQQFMQQNQVPAAMMEDAMNAALLDVKTLVLSQLLMANQQEAQASSSEESKQASKEEDTPSKEEKADGK